MSVSRRDLFRYAAGAGAVATLGQLGMSAALADGSSYRAMVCVFLFGGNDSNNLIVPTDGRYAGYAAGRTSALALPQSSLTPLNGSPFGLHPSLAPLRTAWDEGSLNVVLNTGPLFQPLTKSLYQSRSDLRPLNLMSHADQQNQWQGMRMRDVNATGFLGRAYDRGPSGGVTPMLVSIAGSQLALIGSLTSPLILPSTGTIVRNGFNAATTDAAVRARQAALAAFADGAEQGVITQNTGMGMSGAYSQAVAANTVVSAATSAVDQYFRNPNNGAVLTSDISRQLLRVARMIEARGSLSHSKQSFFVSQGGYDTHANQTNGAGATAAGTQANLYSDLAMALAGFYAAMKALNLAENVTAFTMSDFNRIFRANAQNGTDHAWGGHHLVLGAALRDRTVHGAYPDTTLGGADDIASDGRWIPTIAVEEYVGAIAQWYGVAAADLPYVFPNWATWNGGGRGPVPMFG